MANFEVTKEVVRICRRARVTLFIWGLHGLGKSSLVRQIAEEDGLGFVDFRCAQLEAVDLKGFPDKRGDRTYFLPPSELPSEGQGILFLDELNRAPQDVLSAAFQLVLDRQIGEYKLPEGWSICCAGNFGDEYSVTQLDPAFRDRFCHIKLSAGQATFGEWERWMEQEHGPAAGSVIHFTKLNLRHLEVADKEELGFEVHPSRRSWDMVVRCWAATREGEYSAAAFREVLAGLVGKKTAQEFESHLVGKGQPLVDARGGNARRAPR